MLLRPGGLAVVTARPWRQHGELVDLPAAVIAAGARAGLVPVARCVALLAGLRSGRLIARPSFFQLDNLRRARAKGEPWHLIVHEDVLIFRKPRQRPRTACRPRHAGRRVKPPRERARPPRTAAHRAALVSAPAGGPTGRVAATDPGPGSPPARMPSLAAPIRAASAEAGDLTSRPETAVDAAGPGRQASRTRPPARDPVTGEGGSGSAPSATARNPRYLRGSPRPLPSSASRRQPARCVHPVA